MAKIYVASSWRNKYYPDVVSRLRNEGHDVYDFRNPPHGGAGFHWTDVDENAMDWTFAQYAEGLHHPLAERQFAADLEALKWADVCILVLPCGRSAHTEAGWLAGAGKKVFAYIPEMVEPELMYKLFDGVAGTLDDLVRLLDAGSGPVANGSGTFDVCVVGGSCTGVFAAVRAAEAGMRVALVEDNLFFGGTATAGFVPVWHSLFSTDGRERIAGGLTQLLLDRMVAKGRAVCHEPGTADSESVFAYFNAASLTLELDRLVGEHPSIRPFLGARFVAAETDGPGRVRRIFVEDKSGRRAIEARFFIDCTGDADLLDRVGFETWKQPKEMMQAHTLCALLTGVGEVRASHPDFSFSELMDPKRGARLNHVFQWSAPVIGCPGVVFLAATRVGACDPSDADDLTRGVLDARAQLERIVEAANREFPTDGPGIAIAAIAPEMGLRESRHARCLYQVTGDDVLLGREFQDVIAQGTYRVDIHEGAGITFRYLDGREDRMVADPRDGSVSVQRGRWRPEGGPTPKCYQVPYRAIVPKGSDNVLCAGRMIDASRDAYGALRVMVNCNQMGEAAGRAAAKAVREGLRAADAYPGFTLD